jgi:hypothetical protein
MTLPGLAAVMHEAAVILGEPTDLPGTVARITCTAREVVPGVEQASISIRHQDGTLETLAPTDPIAVEADLVQHELAEGPCFDAAPGELITYAADLADEPRWPTYGPKAAALGFHSQMAARLYDEPRARAGLNLYAVEPGALDGSRAYAEAFACVARVALIQARGRHTIAGALQTREVIGKAVGMVMERYNISDDLAFTYLVRRSQTSNTKLRDVAAEIVATRRMD